MSADFPLNDDLRPERAEALDPVWQLLARAPLAEPDGWFTARTLARCRLGSAAAPSRSWTGLSVWRWVLGTGLGVCLAVFAVTRFQHETVVADHQKNVQEAFEIVASISDDSDSTAAPSPDSWPDSSN
jgi:hypothetical protein